MTRAPLDARRVLLDEPMRACSHVRTFDEPARACCNVRSFDEPARARCNVRSFDAPARARAGAPVRFLDGARRP